MDFESIILTSPEQGFLLKKEIRLIKLALLYSDKITLLSPKTSMLVSVIQLGNLTEDQRLSFIKEVGPIIDSNFDPNELNEVLKQIKKIESKHIRSKEELRVIGRFKSMLKKMEKQFQEMANKFYESSNFYELEPLIETGKLELKHFDFTSLERDEFSKYMSNEINDILSKSETKYPVFDEFMGELVHQYSIENDLNYSQQNPKEIEFGKELILELPNIDQLNIEDMVKIKNELENELLSFKGAILDYSRDIDSEPFSNAAKNKMKKQFEYHIKPDLEALREKIKQNKYLKHLTSEIMSNASSHATQVGLFLGVCTLFDFEKLLSLSGVLGESTYKAYKKKVEGTQNIKENPLFFYNELSRLKN